MLLLALCFAGLSAFLSVGFFVLESVVFTKPTGLAVFRLTREQAETSRVWAFNQGFYNLFLALGILAGAALVVTGNPVAGRALLYFGCASMFGAALVLVGSGGKAFMRGALAQGIPPLVAMLALFAAS